MGASLFIKLLQHLENGPEILWRLVVLLLLQGIAPQLAQVLKTEKDPAVRRQVLRSLGNRRRSTTTVPTLVEAYGAEQDKENKRIIISSLGNMDNAEALVAIARKETSVDLKMAIVEELKDSKSKVAQDYLREILGGK